MIVASHLTKTFGPVKAVQDASFSIEAGQVVGLLGPNGAGKTTTIRMVTGFTPPTRGSVTIAGHDTVTDSRAARRIVGYLPESAPLYPEMRVQDYLKYRATLLGVARRDRKAAISRVMTRCWLDDVAARRIGQLSKGYRQRVGLASSLIHNPSVLILDEPTSGLDPAQIRETRSLIRDLAASRTVLVSSHILPEVEKTCSRVIIIARGRIRADGSPGELVTSLAGQSPYLLEAPDKDAGRLEIAINAIPTVESCSRSPNADGWSRLEVKAIARAGDLREALAGTARQADIALRELHKQAPTLEQVFMRIIEEDRQLATQTDSRGEP